MHRSSFFNQLLHNWPIDSIGRAASIALTQSMAQLRRARVFIDGGGGGPFSIARWPSDPNLEPARAR